MPRILADLALAALLAMSAGPALAAPAVDAAFGNTIVSTYPDGRTAKLWLSADGRYTAQGRRGDPSSGSWRVKKDRLCLHQSRPFPAPFSFCTPIPDAGPGRSWNAKAVTGEAVSVRVVKGRP